MTLGRPFIRTQAPQTCQMTLITQGHVLRPMGRRKLGAAAHGYRTRGALVPVNCHKNSSLRWVIHAGNKSLTLQRHHFFTFVRHSYSHNANRVAGSWGSFGDEASNKLCRPLGADRCGQSQCLRNGLCGGDVTNVTQNYETPQIHVTARPAAISFGRNDQRRRFGAFASGFAGHRAGLLSQSNQPLTRRQKTPKTYKNSSGVFAFPAHATYCHLNAHARLPNGNICAGLSV